jgi:hypothetical protein
MLNKRHFKSDYVTKRYRVDNPVTLMARYDKLIMRLNNTGDAQAQPFSLRSLADKARDYSSALNWVIDKKASINS